MPNTKLCYSYILYTFYVMWLIQQVELHIIMII